MVTATQILPVVPRPPAPIVDKNGVATPEFYRFILSLTDMAINVLPIPPADGQLLSLTLPVVSASTVENLQNNVGAIQAFLATMPPVPPDLTQAVEKLGALLLQIPRTPDLTDRVSKLEALVYSRLL